MDKTQFDDLIKAAKNYYSGLPTGMTDEQYDKLFYQAKAEIPDFNIFDYVNSGSDRADVKHYSPFTPQEFKVAFTSPAQLLEMFSKAGITLGDQRLNKEEWIITPKWDGCSIRAYYKDGKLFDIITRSDETQGKRKFDQLKNKVPNVVPSNVLTIDFEAVTSQEDYGEDTRSHSNGLVNSVYKQDEVDKNLMLIPFKVTPSDVMPYIDAMKLVFKEEDIIAFGYYYKVMFDFETRFLEYKGKHYPIDGYVLYSNTKTNHKIYKFYYNQVPSTTVTNVEWVYTPNKCWNPKVHFNPIYIDGRRCGAATSNGFARLKSLKAGVGAEITVILANSTIPQVHKVLVPSEDYNVPTTCKFCGAPLNEVMGKLRCTNPRCTELVNSTRNFLNRKIAKKLNGESLNSSNKSMYPIDEYINDIFVILVIERFRKMADLKNYVKTHYEAGTLEKEAFERHMQWICSEGQFWVFKRYKEIVWDLITEYVNA